MNFQLTDAAIVPLLWGAVVIAVFNASYLLARRDRKATAERTPGPSKSKVLWISGIGTCIVLPAYGPGLAAQGFDFFCFFTIAVIGVHGWMAEEMVDRFAQQVAKRFSQTNAAEQVNGKNGNV